MTRNDEQPLHDLSTATIDELVQELNNRSVSLLLYMEYEEKELKFALYKRFDPLKAIGVIHERLLPMFRRLHEASMGGMDFYDYCEEKEHEDVED